MRPQLLLALAAALTAAGCYTQGLATVPPPSAAGLPAGQAAGPTLQPPLSPTGLPTPTGAAAVPQTANPAVGLVHTVQGGETVYRIASAYGVPVDALISANRLTDPGQILVGQALIIPADGQTAAAPEAVAPVVSTVPPAPPDPGPPPPVMDAPLWLNGVPLDQIIVLPEMTRLNVRAIFTIGQALGRNPRVFSRLGDSIIENPHFLARFDSGPYNLGDYAYLQPVVDRFAGSFSRQGVAVRRGLHSWSVFDPMHADKRLCAPNETLIACELRLNNPSVLFVRLGTNDVGVPQSFERNMRQLVEYAAFNGVIPVLGTKADRFRDPADTNNRLIRQIAAEYNVPLWDYDRIADTLPGRGLERDGVHLTTFFAHDYTSPVALQRGHGVNNLTALMMLDALWRETALISP